MRHRAKRRRRFSLTREGKGYVFVTFGVGVAAVNTGNNLLYLILGLLLSLLLVSGTLSDLALYQIRAKRRLPARLYVGRAHDVEVTLVNEKRFFPSYSLEVREEGVLPAAQRGHPPEQRGHPPEPAGHPPGRGLTQRGHPPEPGGHPPEPASAAFSGRGGYVVRVPARSHVTVSTTLTPTRRGVQQLGMVLVVTRYPFGLIEKASRRAHPEEVLVFPAVVDVALPAFPAHQRGVVDTSARRGQGPDTLGLRPHRGDDEARDIHWRRSASLGRLVSRERAADVDRSLTLVLDERPPADAALRPAWDEGFERAISECASLAVAALAHGVSVVVRAEGSVSPRVDAGAVPDPVLRFLALLQPADRQPLTAAQAVSATAPVDASPAASARAAAPAARHTDPGLVVRVPVELSAPPGAQRGLRRVTSSEHAA